MEQRNNLEPLPDNSDNEFWGDAEVHLTKPRKIEICETHARTNWMDHRGYVDNHDGTISCKYCPWGGRVTGYMKVHEERVVDMRTFNK